MTGDMDVGDMVHKALIYCCFSMGQVRRLSHRVDSLSHSAHPECRIAGLPLATEAL